MTLRHPRHLFRRALGDHHSAACTTLGPHVDHPVGALDDIEVVLDDDHRVALVHQPLDDQEKLGDVLEVQARGGLVEDVDGPSAGSLLQLGGELDALRLASGQCGCGLTEPHVSETDLGERLEVAVDRGDRLEELTSLLDRHVQHLGDGLALVVHLEGLAVVPRSVADLARDVDVRQEVHLDLQRAVALARLAAAALDVEREPPLLVAPDLGLCGGGEKGADLVEHARVGGRVGPGRPADRRLVHLHQLVERLHAVDPGVPPRDLPGPVELVGQRRREDVVDQGRLARSGYSRDRTQHAAGEHHVHVPEVVLAGATHPQLLVRIAFTARLRERDGASTSEVVTGE